AQIAANDMIGARQTADRIRSDRPASVAFATLAQTQLRAGRLAQAQAIAARIRESATLGAVQRQIVIAQIGTEAATDASATAMNIHDGTQQALAFGDVAAFDVRRGDAASANALATRTRKGHRAQVYERIAVTQAQVGDLPGALETLGRIV